MSHIVVHVGPVVLRFLDLLPDGEKKAQAAVENTPGASYSILAGTLPKPSEVEDAAREFRSSYLERLATTLLSDSGFNESGLFPRLKVVS